ncbi:thioredoxin-like protein [Scleroderma yunnanense]
MSDPTATSTAAAATSAPRRSSRISSKPQPQPAPKATAKAKATTKAKGTAKKSAAAAATKAKRSAGRKRGADELEEEDELESDGDVDGGGGGGAQSGEVEAADVKKAKLPPADADDTEADVNGDVQMADATAAAAVIDVLTNAGASVEKEDQGDAPQKTSVDVGDTIPSVTLKNEQGEDVETSVLVADRGVVLFLVPKADTPGCTTQACGFRDNFQEFTALNYDVYCVSADSPAAQTKWQTKRQLPFHLLSDPNRVLIGALGAADGNKTKRSHFVFEKGGKLIHKKMPLKPADSSVLSLKAIKDVLV